MRRFAVAIYNQNDGDLEIEVIEAENWREAALQHGLAPWTALAEPDEEEDDANEDAPAPEVVPDTINEAKQDAFDKDCAFDIVEIK